MMAACGSNSPVPGKTATPEQARTFVDQVDGELRALWTAQNEADWARSTNITDATEAASAKANATTMEYIGRTIKAAERFVGLTLDADTARKLKLLRLAVGLPAPDDAKKRDELATIAAKMEGLYGKGKFCEDGKCLDLGELEEALADSRNYDELHKAWNGWHQVGREIRPLYERYVTLANEGAVQLGFADVGDLWRSGYDMSPTEFSVEIERLWQQVKPLYEQLHCYVRARLADKYGRDRVPANGTIPAHLLGNMWAQHWGNIYPLVEPFPKQTSIDVTKAMQDKGWDGMQMVKRGEAFYTSLGFEPLPETFWQRSLFFKPADREVVCHASAWDVAFNNDLRIKMCIKVEHEDLVTIHHELGHDYYFNQYYTLPVLYQQGANDGFHEAIGDTIALSMTPGYLQQIGLFDEIPKNEKGDMNQLMQQALDRVAFLPFGMLIDQWRWKVFSGEVSPAQYNSAWWDLRRKYQGIDGGVRSDDDFDPGAKYHLAANVAYMRYFLAHILEFQFHRALCQAAGNQGPLHQCSVFGNKDAGAKFKAMLAMGASKPWPDALEALTGQRQMDASAILDYFAPLKTWIEAQNKGRVCGW